MGRDPLPGGGRPTWLGCVVQLCSPLGRSAFGMAEETGRLINEAIKGGAQDDLGLGKAIGRALGEMKPPYAAYSLLHVAYTACVPVTVHVTVGADIIHDTRTQMAATGAATYRDFSSVYRARPRPQWGWCLPELRLGGDAARSVSQSCDVTVTSAIRCATSTLQRRTSISCSITDR